MQARLYRFSKANGLFTALLTFRVLCACQGPLEPPQANRVQVSLESGAPLTAAPPALRLIVQWPAADTPTPLLLFADELSAYYRRKLAQREIPEALAERQVPLAQWQRDDLVWLAQPEAWLEPERSYALVAEAGRFLAQLTVTPEPAPRWVRRWPTGVEGGAKGGLYCGVEVHGRLSVLLEPDQAPASFVPSLLEPNNCAELRVEAEPEPRRLPSSVDGVFLDPAPLIPPSELEASPEPVACEPPGVDVGGGCLRVLDDRASLTVPALPSLWRLGSGAELVSIEAPAVLSASLIGLEPETQVDLLLERWDQWGTLHPFAIRATTAPALPHVIINEVYANPNGAEPAQEWVELFNSGRVEVMLDGWTLEDVGGSTLLPPAALAPGAFAVVVSERFVADPDYDPVPASDAVLLRVPSLGQNGLNNTGELLRLKDPSGAVQSRAPADPTPKAGKSVARRSPSSDDAAKDSFGYHQAPGSSPGWANELEEP